MLQLTSFATWLKLKWKISGNLKVFFRDAMSSFRVLSNLLRVGRFRIYHGRVVTKHGSGFKNDETSFTCDGSDFQKCCDCKNAMMKWWKGLSENCSLGIDYSLGRVAGKALSLSMFFHVFSQQNPPKNLLSEIFLWFLAQHLIPDPNCRPKPTKKSQIFKQVCCTAHWLPTKWRPPVSRICQGLGRLYTFFLGGEKAVFS